MPIQFNFPLSTGNELEYIAQAISSGRLSRNGPFTKKCEAWLEQQTSCPSVILTHSCTSALEMAAILAGIGPGDEVIMPSYTFVSTANAFVLRSGVPVFIDIRPDTLNIDETQIEAAITEKTKAIVAVHYAGVGCEMDTIMEIANRYGLFVIEDAAQGFAAQYKNKPLGTIGHFGAISFHETKNIISGEGGALFVNDREFVDRARIVSEIGTNRTQFTQGKVNKYTWVDVGSSFQPSDLIAAFLWAQLEQSHAIIARRSSLWSLYHTAFADLEQRGYIKRPYAPPHCESAAHIYFILLEDHEQRESVLQRLNKIGIQAVFHYVPLHSSQGGAKYGIARGDLSVTENISERIIRLPLWPGLSEDQVRKVCCSIHSVFSNDQ